MTIIELRGRINERGELEVRLPAGLPPGDVQVRIEVAAPEPPQDEAPWTDEELAAALQFRPATGAQILQSGVFGVWADRGIEDSVTWVLEQRRKRQERRGW